MIQIFGSFDFSIHNEFRKTYINLTPTTIDAIEVNLLEVDYLDSAALGMLLLLDEHFPGKRIRITHANTFVRQVLDVANFGKKFDIR